MMSRWVLLVGIAAACASGRRRGAGGGDDGDDGQGGQHDASTGGMIDAPGTGVDAKKLDAGGGGGTGLDPDLEIPDPNGQVCHHPGRFGSPECPAGDQVCRYFTSTEGRRETCTSCGNLDAACSATNQCDTLFECFRGHCVGFCTLGQDPNECGAVADCVNIGYPALGVCLPL
jgi:hypothetical protein